MIFSFFLFFFGGFYCYYAPSFIRRSISVVGIMYGPTDAAFPPGSQLVHDLHFIGAGTQLSNGTDGQTGWDSLAGFCLLGNDKIGALVFCVCFS